MITKVVHGWRPGGLIAYLVGPGRSEEHRRPRVIASWDGLDAQWQPAPTGPEEFDLELGPLIRALRAPALAAGLPNSDPSGKRGYVWHCSARVAADDRVLDDAQWAEIARDLLHGAGIAPRDDPGGPRWVAIRHADDHIHIAAVLVRQDTCRRFWPHRDYPKLRETARELERRHGLTITAPADGTASRPPTRGEIEKAARHGTRPARLELARAVRDAAIRAHDPESFASALRDAGYLIELRHAPSGAPLGYKIARAEDRTAAGHPVFYSGSKIAPDLSMPKLLARWASVEAAVTAHPSMRGARHEVDLALAAVRAARVGTGDALQVDDIAQATGDLLAALRTVPTLRGQSLDGAIDLYSRAARAPRGAKRVPSAAGAPLRRLARQLVTFRRFAPDDDLSAAVALAAAIGSLITEIGAWQQERGRAHQAVAARAAAGVVGAWSGVPTAAARPRDTGRAPAAVRPRPGT